MEAPVATETELKFTLEVAELPAFKALACLAGAPVARARQQALYVDTEDCLLFRSGRSLRLRRSGTHWRQTLKEHAGAAGGLFVRPEIESDIADGVIDQAALAVALPAELAAKVSGRLAPRFTVEVERTEWLVPHALGMVAVSCDEGTIAAGDRREPLCEVEFELRSGDVAALFALARDAVATVALHVAPLAKSDRGYRLLGVEPAARDWPVLSGEQPAGEGFRTLARALLGDIARARGDVVATGAVEPVHRLRVGLRRLRSLLAFLPQDSGTAELAAVAAESRAAFRQLGIVRDLDILAAAIPQNAVEAEAALARIAHERMRELERARSMLAARRFAAAMLDLLIFAEGGDAGTEAAAGEPLHAAATRLLSRQWRRLKRMPALAGLSDRRRHRIRIHAKTFRFASDVLGGIYAGGKARRRRRRIEAAIRDLQDTLGRLNDRRNVEALADTHLGPPMAAALGLGAADGDLKAAGKARRRLLRRKAYWR